MLTAQAMETGTYLVTLTFADENGVPMTPTAVTWSLYDPDGGIVNERENVSVTAPATATTIVLTGDDLALTAGLLYEDRVFVVAATYFSTPHGELTLRDSATIRVNKLVLVDTDPE
jgi:hypothetical protein